MTKGKHSEETGEAVPAKMLSASALKVSEAYNNLAILLTVDLVFNPNTPSCKLPITAVA